MRRPAFLFAFALAATLVAPALWLLSSDGGGYGQAPLPAATAGAPPGSGAIGDPDPGRPRAVARPGTAPGPAERRTQPPPTRSARLADQEPAALIAPVRLTVPTLGLDAPVVPAGVVPATGEMEVPEDVRTVGWYRHGVAPGSREGSAVLAAHVDSRRQGRGAFWDLADLKKGAEITVELADGSRVAYVATAMRRYDKAVLPASGLFARSGPHRIVLITCGGPFDAASRSYRDNVVVVAEPRSP